MVVMSPKSGAIAQDAPDQPLQEYARFRSREAVGVEAERTMPAVTPRTIKRMIRISKAHAKARLSRTVEAEDVQLAIKLINHSYLKKKKMINK